MLLDMLEQNFTAISNLFESINTTITQDLGVITMFDEEVNGTTVMDARTRLQNVYMAILYLNGSSYNTFQTLWQIDVNADSLQNDFDSAQDNITESLNRINETTELLLMAERFINSTEMQNYDNRNSLSLLSDEISIIQRNLQAELDRAQSYVTQVNSTYLRSRTLLDELTVTEQESLNSSILIEQLYNYSNISLNLSTDAAAELEILNVRNIVILDNC